MAAKCYVSCMYKKQIMAVFFFFFWEEKIMVVLKYKYYTIRVYDIQGNSNIVQ